MAESTPKKDPTVSSKATEESAGAHQARPIDQADDYAGDKQYADMKDKPAPETVAQVEVLPDDKSDK